jgi:hypothetical protein
MTNKLTEYEECKIFANYLREQWLRFSHIPNSTWTPSWWQRTKNKLLWVSSWFPDYVVIVPWAENDLLIWVEMKVVWWWKVSDNQKARIRSISKCWLNIAVCKWSQEAISYIQTFINIEKK